MRGAWRRIVCVMCAVMSLTACLKGEGVAPSSDAHLDAALSAFIKEGGGPVALSSMTDFDWDQFGVVGEGTKAEEIESLFGERIIREKRYLGSASLFVFLKDGKVVRALMVAPDVFHPGDFGKLFTHGVMLRGGGEGLVRFVEPG
mgnify:FL=1